MTPSRCCLRGMCCSRPFPLPPPIHTQDDTFWLLPTGDVLLKTLGMKCPHHVRRMVRAGAGCSDPGPHHVHRIVHEWRGGERGACHGLVGMPLTVCHGLSPAMFRRQVACHLPYVMAVAHA